MRARLSVAWVPLLTCAWRLDAQPLVYQGTGTREQVQAAVNQFESF